MKECPACGTCADDSENTCPVHGLSLSPTLPGPRLLDGKYRLEARQGRGGMGAVYRARHLGLDRAFALKLVLPDLASDPSFLAFFRSEALALGRLRHPGVVGVTDFGVDPRGAGVPYLVMELLEGRSLAELLRREGPLSPARALGILRQVAEAVDQAHALGVLHRDLKPSNIFLAGEGPGETAKVLDFGLAHLLEGPSRDWKAPGRRPSQEPGPATGDLRTVPIPVALDPAPNLSPHPATVRIPVRAGESPEGWSSVHELVGTPEYLAPESIEGRRPGPSVDVYAFGVLAYEMIVGRVPFQGSLEEVLTQQARMPPPAPSRFQPGIPSEVENALLGFLAKEPATRPPSLGEAQAILERACAVHGIHAWRRHEVPRRLRYALLAAAVATALAWALPRANVVAALEHRLEDLRTSLAPPRAGNPRILLVGLREASLDDGSANFFEKADRLVEGLESLLEAGADKVGVDLLLPRRFAASERLSRLVLTHRERLVLGLFAGPGGEPKGWECLSPLTRAALGSQAGLERLFGLLNLEPDSDGRIRRFQVRAASPGGQEFLPLAARLSGAPKTLGLHRINLAVDPATFQRVPWDGLPQRLAADPGLLRGRLVLVGVDSPALEDMHAVPGIRGRPSELSGLSIHALILHTLHEGGSGNGPPWAGPALAAALSGLCAWTMLRTFRAWKAWLWVGILLAGSTGLLVLLGAAGQVLPMAGPLLATLVICAGAPVARRLLPPIPPPLPPLEGPHAS
ncbi:MAG: protein kinase [Acidobacteria bacterium]|nr:protein kinase [Acidobacteriota bacterium]